MVSSHHKDIIVNAIRVLRARRVRPSFSKIAWLVQREHNLSEKTLQTLIEALVDSKDILRVHFKGAISYRVPPRASGALPTATSSPSVSLDLSSESEVEDGSDEKKSISSSAGLKRGSGLTKLSYRNSAPKPRMSAVPQVRDGDASSAAKLSSSTFSDTISRVILNGGGGGSSSSSGGSSGNGSVTPMSGRSTPTMEGSDGDQPELPCNEFETPVSAPPARPTIRGARRGRPPLSASMNREESRRGRPPSSRTKPQPLDGSSLGNRNALTSSTPSRLKTKALGDQTLKLKVVGGRGGRSKRRSAKFRARDAMYAALLDSSPPTTSRQRAKRVYDPSEGGGAKHPNGPQVFQPLTPQSYGRHKRGEDGGMHSSVCDICQAPSLHHGEEFMLRCTHCSATGHPSCLGYSASLAERSRRRPWTCMDCKLCTVCAMDHLVGTLIFCDECDRAYHLTCHRPALTTQPRGTWVCCMCRANHSHVIGFDGQVYQSPQASGSGFPLTPRDSPIPDEESRGSSGGLFPRMGTIDPTIPVAISWTVEEVASYFQEKGFQDEAAVLKEQAIDGNALMLLSRPDVVQNLGFKLGPSVKLYKQIRILQTRTNNPPTHC